MKYFGFLAIVFSMLCASAQGSAQTKDYVRGFNIIESADFLFDASDTQKTVAQVAVDKAKELGANHIIINLKAIMKGPRSSEVVTYTPPMDRGLERQRLARLVNYIKSQNMTVGFRPIFFVMGPNGEFPYNEHLSNGKIISWWHGNIQPADPNTWFQSYKVYLDVYLPLAQALKVDEFTIGAELYSMTVGLEDQWLEYPYGFPGRWLEILRYVRSKLPTARLMYDINFTDDEVKTDGFGATGGELERWRYRIVDLANRNNPDEKKIWTDLTQFWIELDAIGIDVYRSLAKHNQTIPAKTEDLVHLLRQRTDTFATQMDNILNQVNLTLMARMPTEKPVIFKELGFRSVDKGFIDPYTYAGSGVPNVQHQAAAFRAYFESFWEPKWTWFKGLNIWEVSLNPDKVGSNDNGFSPVGKKESEDVIKKYFKN